MTDAAVNEMIRRFDNLERVVVRVLNSRLNRQDMAERLDVSPSTLDRRVKAGTVPRPNADGKWLLSEVVEWEAGQR